MSCRVYRGGSFFDPAVIARVANRNGNDPSVRDNDLAARFARTPEDEDAETVSRVNRGGSFYDPAVRARVAFRGRYVPSIRINDLGFRVVKEVD